MTYDEVLKKYPLKKYEHRGKGTSYSGFQDSIEKKSYEIVYRKTNTVVDLLTHTLVNEGINTTEDYWS